MGDDVVTSGSGAGHEGLLGSSFSETWELFKRDAVLLILAGLLMTVVSVVSIGILAGPAYFGYVDIVRKRRRGESASVGDVMSGLSSFGTSFGIMVLIIVGTLIGLLLLVVPGLIFLVGASFAMQEAVYRQVSAIDAIKGSIEIVKSNVSDVLVLLIVMFVLNMLGGAVFFGQLLTGPFATVLSVVAYEKLTRQTQGR